MKRSRVKVFVFDALEPVLNVHYRLPANLDHISIECALSPDYVALLRHGSEIMKAVNGGGRRGFATGHVAVTLEPATEAQWERPAQEWISHARTVRLGIEGRQIHLKLSIGDASQETWPQILDCNHGL